jgi:phosphatidylserine/phosphatidylglycerophosphate/cardiolipin synthase-like enzyme
MYAEHSSPFQTPALAAPAGGTTLQVVATLPPPIAEQSILETWRKALAHAQRYIYIEDQYFRMPILNDLIARRLRDVPELRLIVITKPVTPADGGKKYTVQSDDLFRATAPDRYLLLQLKSFDAVPRGEVAQGDESASFYFADMDVHSKILMVDDEYLSVGSCNKNNRGLLYEGELNVAVHDPAWVTEARREVFRNLVGPERAGDVSDDAATSFTLLRVIAEDNAAKEEWWRTHGPGLDQAEVESFATGMRPQGFVYPLALTPDYLLDVGPDAF